MPINIYEKMRKAFTGTTGIADAVNIETTANSNVQADLNSRINGAVRDGDNIQFSRGDGTTFNVSIIEAPEPAFTSFVVGTQGTEVDAPFTISGATPVTYTTDNPGNFQGLLTVLQELTAILPNLTPQASFSGFALVNSVTLNAGQSVTFRIRGTSALAGNPSVERTYTITARNPQDFLYLSAETDSDPSDVDTGAATAIPFTAGNQVVTIPTFTGNRFLTILQRASDPEITQILIGGINQFAAFTKTDDAISVNSVLFDAYVSTNQLVGSAVSGQQMTLVR